MNALNGLAVLDTADSSRIVQLSDTSYAVTGSRLVGATPIAPSRRCAVSWQIWRPLMRYSSREIWPAMSLRRLTTGFGRHWRHWCPSFWLPGNHDAIWSPEHQLSEHFKRHIRLTHWDILMLNTQREGMVAGYLSDGELQGWRRQSTKPCKPSGPCLWRPITRSCRWDASGLMKSGQKTGQKP